jgi:tRNA pseudouridine38-40 synthase
MRRAAASLVGTHDFAAFGRSPRSGGSTVRRVESVAVRQSTLAGSHGAAPGSAVVIEVVADAFLYGMMRSIAGALVAVGQARMRGEQLAALVQQPPPQRPPLPVAPAHGLHQWRVTYPEAVTR